MRKCDLYSVIQPDFKDLILTGEYAVHHVFPGYGRRRKCEKYGFLVALRPSLHSEVHANPNGTVSRMLKDECKKYWLENIGTEDEFRKEFR